MPDDRRMVEGPTSISTREQNAFSKMADDPKTTAEDLLREWDAVDNKMMEFRKKVRGPGHRPSTPKRHGPSIIIAPGRKEPPTAPKPAKNDSEPFDLPSPQVVIFQLLGILLVLLVWGLGQLAMPTAEGVATPTSTTSTWRQGLENSYWLQGRSEVSDAYLNFQRRMAEFEARYHPQEEESISRKKRQYLPVDFNPEAERWMRQEFKKGYDRMQDIEKKKKWAEDFRMDLLKIKEEHRRNRVLAHQRTSKRRRCESPGKRTHSQRLNSIQMV
jgi:hypothetical protein